MAVCDIQLEYRSIHKVCAFGSVLNSPLRIRNRANYCDLVVPNYGNIKDNVFDLLISDEMIDLGCRIIKTQKGGEEYLIIGFLRRVARNRLKASDKIIKAQGSAE